MCIFSSKNIDSLTTLNHSQGYSYILQKIYQRRKCKNSKLRLTKKLKFAGKKVEIFGWERESLINGGEREGGIQLGMLLTSGAGRASTAPVQSIARGRTWLPKLFGRKQCWQSGTNHTCQHLSFPQIMAKPGFRYLLPPGTAYKFSSNYSVGRVVLAVNLSALCMCR